MFDQYAGNEHVFVLVDRERVEFARQGTSEAIEASFRKNAELLTPLLAGVLGPEEGPRITRDDVTRVFAVVYATANTYRHYGPAIELRSSKDRQRFVDGLYRFVVGGLRASVGAAAD